MAKKKPARPKELTVAPKDLAALERDITTAWRALFPKDPLTFERTHGEMRRITGPTGLIVNEIWNIEPAVVYTRSSILGRKAHRGWKLIQVLTRQVGGYSYEDPPDWDEDVENLGTFRASGQVAEVIALQAARFTVNAALQHAQEIAFAQEEERAQAAYERERAEREGGRYAEEWERGR